MDITPTTSSTKKFQKNIQHFHAHKLEYAPQVEAQAWILWDNGKDYSKKPKKPWILAKAHGRLFFLICCPTQSFGLCFSHFPILCLTWWNFTLISGRTDELWCFSLIAALCTSLTAIRQSTGDVKSFWFQEDFRLPVVSRCTDPAKHFMMLHVKDIVWNYCTTFN